MKNEKEGDEYNEILEDQVKSNLHVEIFLSKIDIFLLDHK